MREEILPNMVLPVLTDFGLRFVFVVLLLSGLSFLGLGIQPPNADWGSLVRENISGLSYGAAGGDHAGARHRHADDRRQPADRQPARRRPGRRGAPLMRKRRRGRAACASPPAIDRGAETTIIKDVSFEVARGEVRGADRRIRLGQDDDRALADGLCAARLPHRRRQHPRSAAPRSRRCRAPSSPICAAAASRYVAQSAAASFNPAQRIMTQVIESARIHRLMPREAAEAKALGLFRALALPDPERVGARFPHQVSGGQLQRLMAAMALIADPELVILDEPTTALDVTTQIEVLRAFKTVVRELQTTAVYVSHDLAVVAQIADRIIVLRDGEIREIGATAALLRAPRDAYTKSLLDAAAPTARHATEASGAATAAVLEVRGLLRRLWRDRRRRGCRASRCCATSISPCRRRSVLGVIGESGCGKSTLARVIAGLLPAARGSVRLRRRGAAAPRAADGTREQLRRIQIVFQMADTALNPGASDRRASSAGRSHSTTGSRGAALRAAGREAARHGAPAVRISPSAIRASCRAARSSASTSRARSPPSPSSSSATR